ncbi:hypothetical protein FOZ63_026409, partial [Perkinsus olseni]
MRAVQTVSYCRVCLLFTWKNCVAGKGGAAVQLYHLHGDLDTVNLTVMKSSLPKGGEGEPDDDVDDDHHADGERRRIRFNNNVGAAGAADEGHNEVPSVVPASQQPTRPALVAVPDHIRNAGKRIRFDEAVIAEHDLERGTRMTIDEPDTPFVRTPLSSGESSEDSSSTHGGRGAHIRMG